jgi:hypothetical protein
MDGTPPFSISNRIDYLFALSALIIGENNISNPSFQEGIILFIENTKGLYLKEVRP